MNQKDTVVALSTAGGSAALALIRLSGSLAIEMVAGMFPKNDLKQARGKTLHTGELIYQGTLLDQVVVGIFRAPLSYTGEDVVEITCHGSMLIVQQITEALIGVGARPARPGEFTLRAFVNGKMDLSQAEAVSDLISAETASSHRMAMQQLKGGFTSELQFMRSELLRFSALVELELDFSEEQVEFAARDELKNILQRLEIKIKDLLRSFSLGNVLKKGIPVTISGKPNAGKSTLLNRLINEERAIVSPLAGTTRDTLEESLNIDGLPFRLIDTAGLRDDAVEIEAIGIQRAQAKMAYASFIIYLFDPNETSPVELTDTAALLHSAYPQAEVILTGNKADQHEIEFLDSKYSAVENIVWISAKENYNIDLLKNALLKGARELHFDSDELVINNARHFDALNRTLLFLESAQSLITAGERTELLAFEIAGALRHIGEITGEVTNDEILASIFSKFCIGK